MGLFGPQGPSDDEGYVVNVFFQNQYPHLLRIARAMCPAEEDAWDVVQEACLAAVAQWDTFRGEGERAAWLRSILRNAARMWYRREKHRRMAPLPPNAAFMREDTVLLRIDLERALEEIKSTTQSILWRHDVEGLTHPEIAAQDGRTESYSKTQLSRGRHRLREILAA